MSTPTMNHTDSMFDTIASALESGTFVSQAKAPVLENGIDDLATAMVAAVRDAAQRRPQVVPAKDFTAVPDQSFVTKSWLTDLGHVIATAVPIIVQAVSKDFQPTTQTVQQALAAVPAHRREDKDWVDLTAHILSVIVPAALDALQGTKDFDPSGVPEISVAEGKDKDFWSDAWNVVKQVGPPLISAAIAAL